MNDSTVLYVEDESGDVILMQRVWPRAGLSNPLKVVSDGQEAVDYLAGQGEFTDRERHPLPGLILLDLNVPRKSGFEVLQWLRQQPGLNNTLVVVFSSSQQTGDVERSYQLGANGYLVKPIDYDKRIAMIKALGDYWLVHNEAPPRP